MYDFGKHEFDRVTVDMRETGFALRKIRENNNIPVSDVAKYLGTSIQSIYTWEIGKNTINFAHFVSLCAFYKINPNDVICKKTEKAVYYDYDE